MSRITLDHIRAGLALSPPTFDPQAAQLKVAPSVRPRQRPLEKSGTARLAATMMVVYPIQTTQVNLSEADTPVANASMTDRPITPEQTPKLGFALTRRPDTLRNHAGQISFPGGRQDEGEDFAQTALRETCEELGICGQITLLGPLTPLYIPPSDFQVYPYVGYLDHHPTWQRHEHEVAEVIECQVETLLDDSIKHWDEAEYQGFRYTYGWYHLEGHRVWGATAIILSEFEWRLRTVLQAASGQAE